MLLLLSTTALVGIAVPVLAADTTWTGATDTDWSVSTNWDTSNVPTNADNVFVNTTTGFPVIGVGTTAAGAIVTIGDTASGALQIQGTGAELNATSLVLGDGAQGHLSIANTGALLLTNDFYVGQGANGFATITGSSALTAGNGIVGFGDTTTGQLTFANSATGTFSSNLSVGIGTDSDGTLTINTGADVDTVNLYLGSNVGAQGTALVNGTDSTLDVSALLAIGDSGTGILTIADNAVVTANLNNNVNVGNAASANGTVTVSSGGSLTLGGPFVVGNFGTGTLTVESAGAVSATSFAIGSNAGGNGTATVAGVGSTLTAATGSYVGNEGTGALNIASGGVVDVQTGFLRIGGQAGSTGAVSVAGSDSEIDVTGQLQVGFAGSGQLTIADDANVTAANLVVGAQLSGIGTITVSAAVLVADLSATIGVAGSGTLTVSDGGAIGVDGGGGTLTLAQNAGSSGTLNIGAAPAQSAAVAGTLTLNTIAFGAGTGTINFNHTDTNYVINENITGGADGTLNHIAGVTELTGDASNFLGTTSVIGGSFYVNNMLGGAVSVDGGRLGGNGTLTGTLALNSGGTIAPGNSIGTLNVANIVMNAGSTYEVELNDSGLVAGTNNDLINATGTATINGGTVHVTPENGTDTGTTYTAGTYTIVTAAGGVIGAFDALTDDYAFLNFALAYDANNVFLTSSAVTSFCLSGMSANQCATGDGVLSLGSGGLYTAVLNLSNAEAPGALDLLSGEIHASAKTALIDDSRFVREAAVARTRAAFDAVASDRSATSEQHISDRLAFWGQGFGSWGQWDGDGNAGSLDRSIGGLFLGGDARLDGNVRVGVLGGYSRSDFDVNARASSGDADSYHLGLYGGGQWGALGLRFGGAYASHNVETARAIAFTGFSDQLTAAYDAATAQVFGDAGYRIVAGQARFEPFANLAYVNLDSDDVTESGGDAALSVASGATDTTFMTLGVRADTALMLGGADARLRGTLGWRHAFGEDVPTSLMTFVSGSDAFTIAGVPIAEDVLVVDAGIDVILAPAAALGFAYGAQFGSGVSDQGLKARLDVKF